MARWVRFGTFGTGSFRSLVRASSTHKLLVSGALVFTALFSGAPPAHAQATRTWVSGVGDDVNPCSRTAPCKTFAGAISKTAVHGEINAIDAAGFGVVTITKSITIDGGESYSSILNAGSPGISINISPSTTQETFADSHVTIRNLTLNGANSGTDGIRILSANEVYIENVNVFNNKGAGGEGISDTRSNANGKLFVTNATIQDNISHGISLLPGSGSLKATLNAVRLVGNGDHGLIAQNGSQVTMVDSETSSNNIGIATGNNTQVNVDRTIISNNTTGINSFGNGTTRVSNSMIMNNATNGIIGSLVFGTSPGTNQVEGNGGNQSFTGTVTLK